MKRFRSLLFWTHLTAGVLGGVVILVMSFTGVVLALKPQIQNWVDRESRYVVPQGDRLSPSVLLSAVKAARPDANLQSVALDRDPTVAALIGLGGRDGNVYVNPYSGAILGPQSRKTQELFQSMTSWHRYMGASGESRPIGRAATGASNLAFLLLGLSGLYLWWPKALSAKYLRPIVWFRTASTSKARDFNWHNTIGFWCLIPIVIMTASGVMMSYTWGNNLVYRLAGSPIPVRGGGPNGPAPAEARGADARGAEGRAGGGADARARAEGAARRDDARTAEMPAAREGQPRAEGGRRPEGGGPAGPNGQGGATVIPASIDLLFARAQQQVPTWGQLSLRLPAREGAPVQFTLTDGAQWNDFARSQLTLNGTTGEVAQWQPYEGQTRGQKWRGWLRFAHTGELGGLAGQIIAGIGCLGGVFLVYTGLALATRRLWNWSLWKRMRGERQSERTAPLFGTPASESMAARTAARAPLMDEH